MYYYNPFVTAQSTVSVHSAQFTVICLNYGQSIINLNSLPAFSVYYVEIKKDRYLDVSIHPNHNILHTLFAVMHFKTITTPLTTTSN
jgi:hypothetical protein